MYRLTQNFELYQIEATLDLIKLIERLELNVDISEAQNTYFSKIYSKIADLNSVTLNVFPSANSGFFLIINNLPLFPNLIKFATLCLKAIVQVPKMSDKFNDYGMLLNQDIKLHRTWFKQMTKLLGINCIYKAPMENKTFDNRGDLQSAYQPGILVECIFQEHPDQKTLKKMG